VRRGAHPPVVVGVGMALQPSGGSGTPVRSAFVGTAFTIAGIVAALGFGSSLERFVTSPARYGLDWDVSVETNGRRVAMERDLVRERGVDAVATVRTATLRIGGTPTDLYTIDPAKGAVQATIVHGRAPATDGEVALGADVRKRLGAAIGDAVTLPGVDGTKVPLRVVGESLPLDPQTERGLAGTMLVTPATFDRLVAPGDPGVALEAAIRFAPGADRGAVIALLRADYPGALTDESRPDRPVEVRNLAQLGALPLVLGGTLLAIGLAAIGHALLTVSRRRRRDLAVLRAIGFSGRQLRATLFALAVTVLLVGLVVGVPLGLLVARLAWGGVARDLAVDGTLISPVGPILGALVAAGLLLLVAALPARSVGRLRTAEALRRE
jgi:predicted lysophospholipase L1 biosynthesis ABC-type transport system permease subunit